MQSSGAAEFRVDRRAGPADLVALLLALEERDTREGRDRDRFDREVGVRLSAYRGTTLIRAWSDAASSPPLRERVARVRSALSLMRWLLVGMGFFFGWAASAALLQYEVHAGRINIVVCLVVLVVLPLVMLLFSSLGLVASEWRRTRDSESRMSWRDFALTRLAMRLFPPAVREDIEIVLGRLSAHSRLYGPVRRAQLFLWSQWMGLSFMFGVLAATLAFVVLTDLAFGWSTTLDVNSASIHRIVALIASPWESFWPAAAPTFDLVETTRYFRAADVEHSHLIDPIRYGGWWPFLVASMLIYALLPRLAVAAIGWSRLGRVVEAAIANTPGVDRLADRLTTPVIETQATSPETETGRPEHGLVPTLSLAEWKSRAGGGSISVLRWAEASSDAALVSAFDLPGLEIRDAGGRRSLAEDRELIAALGGEQARREEGRGIVLCVRAFEPPVLEVLDFLGELRRAIGSERRLGVLLVGGESADHEAWRRKLMGLGDSQLGVVPFADEARGDDG